MHPGAMRRQWSAALAAVSILASAMLTPVYAKPLSQNQVKVFHQRVSALHRAGRYAEALAAAQKWVIAAQKSERSKPGLETANALGASAWQALFAKRFDQALAASELAMSMSPNAVWIKTNYAHALLFLGRTDEAVAAYTAHKGRIFWAKTRWEAAVAKDFAEFRARGLDRPEMQRVEEALAKPKAPKIPAGGAKAPEPAPKASEASPKQTASNPAKVPPGKTAGDLAR